MNGEMYILGGKISEGRVEEPMVIFVGVLIVMDDIKLPSSHTAEYKYTIEGKRRGSIYDWYDIIDDETHPAQHSSQNEAIQVEERDHKVERKITPGVKPPHAELDPHLHTVNKSVVSTQSESND